VQESGRQVVHRLVKILAQSKVSEMWRKIIQFAPIERKLQVCYSRWKHRRGMAVLHQGKMGYKGREEDNVSFKIDKMSYFSLAYVTSKEGGAVIVRFKFMSILYLCSTLWNALVV
jgi:hypothetical protein